MPTCQPQENTRKIPGRKSGKNRDRALPLVGDTIKTYLMGGPAIGDPTLNRFFSLHYLLPFVIAGVVVMLLGCQSAPPAAPDARAQKVVALQKLGFTPAAFAEARSCAVPSTLACQN